MKQIQLIMLLLLFGFIFGCNDSPNDKSQLNQLNGLIITDNVYDTLDLNNDQVVPGGLSEGDIQVLLEMGYVLDTLDATTLLKVTFSDGYSLYQVIGYVRAGEVMLIMPNSDPPHGYFKLCGNHWLDEEV